MRVLIALFLMIHYAPARSYEDYADPCYAEVIHWNVPQVNPYENTLIVVDPYGE